MRSTLLLPLILGLMVAGPAHPEDRLADYVIVDGTTIPEALGGKIGDADRGRQLAEGVIASDIPACGGCHDGFADAAGQDAATLRMWLVAPDILAPGTSMPSYYRAGQRSRADDPRHGEPFLTAAQIEDLVAWLVTLSPR